MTLRAQCSLIFEDEQLYKGLIEPLKQTRELSSVILRCLSAYYYNSEIRSGIDDLANGIKADDPSQEEYSSLIAEMQNMLTLQTAISNKIQNIVEDGIDDVDDVLSTINKQSVKHGFAKETQSEYGTKLLSVNVDKVEEFDSSIQDEFKHIRTKIESGKPQDMADGVIDMGKLILTQLASMGKPISQTNAQQSEQVVSSKTTSTTNESQVLMTGADNDFDFYEEQSDVVEPIEATIEEPVVIEEDASAGLLDALSSLDF